MVGRDIANLVTMILDSHPEQDEVSIHKELANKLDINIKTFTSWITKKADNSIGRPYVAYLRRICEPFLIKARLQVLEEKAFAIAPSEFICFWIVCGTEVLLLKDTARNELFPSQFKYHNDEIHKRLTDISMTIDSIQETKVINAFADGISSHKKKVVSHTMTNHLSGGICYSMLKLPLVIRSTIGPRVIGLVDLQNKLEKNEKDEWKPIQDQLGKRNTDSIYTEQEIDAVRELALSEYNDHLKPIMEALDYLDPQTSPYVTL